MTTIARTVGGTHRRAYGPPVSAFTDWAVVSWIMSHRTRYWPLFEQMQDPSIAFVEYLEGYASSMDIYPVCSRNLSGHHNIGSVVDDFWQVAADYAASVDECARRRALLSGLKELDDGQGSGSKK